MNSSQAATNIALVLAAIAIIPSAGAFTPAIIGAALAALVGSIAIMRGHVRRGVLTVYLALCAAVVSPAWLNVGRVETWLIGLHVLGALLGLLLFLDYKRSKKSADAV